MAVLVSAGISHVSSESARGWRVSSAFWAELSHRLGSWLAAGSSRMATADTSDGLEPHLGSPPQSNMVAG